MQLVLFQVEVTLFPSSELGSGTLRVIKKEADGTKGVIALYRNARTPFFGSDDVRGRVKRVLARVKSLRRDKGLSLLCGKEGMVFRFRRMEEQQGHHLGPFPGTLHLRPNGNV